MVRRARHLLQWLVLGWVSLLIFAPKLGFSQVPPPEIPFSLMATPDPNTKPLNIVPSQVAPPATPLAVQVAMSKPINDPAMKAVLEKDLADLANVLAGRWDNELQTFFEPELAIPASKRHERLHVFVKPIDASAFGGPSFYVEYRKGGEAGPIVRQRVWHLRIDQDLMAIRMAGFAPKDPKPLEGAWRQTIAADLLKKEAFIPVTGCDIIWRRRGDGFRGETRPTACKLVTNADKRILTVSEYHDISADIWEVRDVGVDEKGNRVFGGAEAIPTRLKRARTFICWAGVVRGGDRSTVSDLVIHDQGGMANVVVPGNPASQFRIRLRSVEWPMGLNRPSLTLYLLLDGDDRAEGYVWGEINAQRLALDLAGTQVSCTKEERALWR
ncbi:chromophore lyase CpcT/CpeT [Candidatus Phycosocius spiralis]|uniref:Uncharacterized protein n=1 Tax=Candidatus Phycosocius spiralis TaxID=2815099 RepID=A0ABQ4PXE3_9PROT|nr:chromophore lyase CpcT/CpeT [Candidatus Phycosocius spiralis]GIU67639.1 hypothetical protein PsB1_1793 [Candidatus Phycosocius spiralis]